MQISHEVDDLQIVLGVEVRRGGSKMGNCDFEIASCAYRLTVSKAVHGDSWSEVIRHYFAHHKLTCRSDSAE